jgi:hypothetical protein
MRKERSVRSAFICGLQCSSAALTFICGLVNAAIAQPFANYVDGPEWPAAVTWVR